MTALGSMYAMGGGGTAQRSEGADQEVSTLAGVSLIATGQASAAEFTSWACTDCPASGDIEFPNGTTTGAVTAAIGDTSDPSTTVTLPGPGRYEFTATWTNGTTETLTVRATRPAPVVAEATRSNGQTSNVSAGSVALSLSDTAGADSVAWSTACRRADTNASVSVTSSTTTTPSITAADSSDGQGNSYHWRSVATDAYGRTAVFTATDRVAGAADPVSATVSPVGNNGTGTSQTFTITAAGGSGSYTYAEQVALSGPGGHGATLADPTTATPDFTGMDTAGRYTATIRVSDASDATNYFDVELVFVKDADPAITISESTYAEGSSTVVADGTTVTLALSVAGDSGGTWLTTVTKLSTGASVTVTNSTAVNASFDADQTGNNADEAYLVKAAYSPSIGGDDVVYAFQIAVAGIDGESGLFTLGSLDFTGMATESLTTGNNTLTDGTVAFWTTESSSSGSVDVTNGTGLVVVVGGSGSKRDFAGVNLATEVSSRVSDDDRIIVTTWEVTLDSFAVSPSNLQIGYTDDGTDPGANASTDQIQLRCEVSGSDIVVNAWFYAGGFTGPTLWHTFSATSAPHSFRVVMLRRASMDWWYIDTGSGKPTSVSGIRGMTFMGVSRAFGGTLSTSPTNQWAAHYAYVGGSDQGTGTSQITLKALHVQEIGEPPA